VDYNEIILCRWGKCTLWRNLVRAVLELRFCCLGMYKAFHLVATEAHTILFINIFPRTAEYPDDAFYNTQEAHDLTHLYVTYGTPVNLTFPTRMLSFVYHDVTQTACTNEASI
jgi:hypothetical protein